MKKILTILAVILLLNVFGSSVCAEDDKEEKKGTYTVTVSAGLHGMLEDEKGNKVKQIEVQIEAGGEWNPSNYVIKPENIDELYYFKGYHVAGIETLVGAQDITHDIVFVASYGIENNLVEYYVNYVDENGNGIGPIRNTYVGNVGDKPVIAFVHINGYAPKVRNYTGTLKEDEVLEFTFEYRENRIDTVTIVEDEIEGSTYNGGAGQGTVPGEEQGSNTEENTLVDIIDIDEGTTPTTEPDNIPDGGNEGQTETNSFLAFLQKYGLLMVGGLLLLFLLLLFLLLRRRKEDEE